MTKVRSFLVKSTTLSSMAKKNLSCDPKYEKNPNQYFDLEFDNCPGAPGLKFLPNNKQLKSYR